MPAVLGAGCDPDHNLVMQGRIQGVFVGGVVASTHTIRTESVSPAWRGAMSGLVGGGGAGIGALLASFMFLITSSVFPGDAFAVWGWRVMFFSGLLSSLLGWFIFKSLEESPFFKEQLRKKAAGKITVTQRPVKANGKPHGAAARHSSQMGSQSGLQGTRPAAAAVLGISPAAELSLLGSQMHTSNRSACHPCSNRVSATSRTAVYGPVRTVVWEGRSCEAPPYPDHWRKAAIRRNDVSADFRGAKSSALVSFDGEHDLGKARNRRLAQLRQSQPVRWSPADALRCEGLGAWHRRCEGNCAAFVHDRRIPSHEQFPRLAAGLARA
jgi:hypothetical protein